MDDADSKQRPSTTSNRFSVHMPSRENDPGGVTFQTTQQKLKYCLALLMVTVVSGGAMLYKESTLVLPGLWMAPQTDSPPSIEGRATNSNILEPRYKMAFSGISRLPYFYKPVSFHASDKYRQKKSYSVDFTHGYHPVRSSKSKLILFHNPPGWFSDAIQRNKCQQGIQACPEKNCQCSYDPKQMDRADAVIFDGVELKYRTPPPKQTNQVWILFGLECPFYYNNQLYLTEQWRHVFNWTMTYRLDSDVIMPYNILYKLPQPPKVNFSQIAQKKTKSVLWFVSNCNTPSKRKQYVKELGKHISVDIYGRCGPLKCRGPECDNLYNQYRFYLSFENSFCVDYITEKLFKVYSQNIVPVVRGGADYKSMVPNGTYINSADFSSPKELATYLKYLETNVTAYAEILETKSRYIAKGGTFKSAFCDICVKLNNLMSYRQQYYDSVQWLKQDTCRPPKDI